MLLGYLKKRAALSTVCRTPPPGRGTVRGGIAAPCLRDQMLVFSSARMADPGGTEKSIPFEKKPLADPIQPNHSLTGETKSGGFTTMTAQWAE